MLIRIEGTDLPGLSCGAYRNVHVAVQGKGRPPELLGVTPADAPSVSWTLACDPTRMLGPQVQGPPGGRFVYLTWGEYDGTSFAMFRRAKLWLEAVPAEVLAAAAEGILVGRLGLTDAKGMPLCASLRPPRITWSVG